jgi:hypothetical protein
MTTMNAALAARTDPAPCRFDLGKTLLIQALKHAK